MSLKFRYLGISGFEAVASNGTRLLFDPFVAGSKERGVLPSPVSLDQLLGVNLILITHGAWDHVGDAVDLAIRSDATIACGPEVRLHILSTGGLRDDQVFKIFQGCERTVHGLKIKALHAEHVSFVQLGDQWLTGSPLSYLVEFEDGARVFHSGDTSLFGDLKLYGDLYRPDIVMLGIGATEPGLTALPPSEAALAADWLGAPVVIPMHYMPGSRAPDEFAAAVAARRPDIRVVPLEPGGWYSHDRTKR